MHSYENKENFPCIGDHHIDIIQIYNAQKQHNYDNQDNLQHNHDTKRLNT